MRYRLLMVALMGFLLTWVGCGSGGTSILNRFGAGTGTVVLLASDQPVCDVTSFQVTVTGITLVPQNGGASVSVLSSSQPVTLDLASLMDVSALLSVTDVPAGTYSQISFTLSNPQLTSIDFTQNPPVPATITPTMQSLTLTYDISPALSVTANSTVGLQIDFDLRNSLAMDRLGNVTGNADLVATAGPVTAASGTGFGELRDLHGLVQSVSSTGSGSTNWAILLPGNGVPCTANALPAVVMAAMADANKTVSNLFLFLIAESSFFSERTPDHAVRSGLVPDILLIN